jgi:hypothetical protein
VITRRKTSITTFWATTASSWRTLLRLFLDSDFGCSSKKGCWYPQLHHRFNFPSLSRWALCIFFSMSLSILKEIAIKKKQRA